MGNARKRERRRGIPAERVLESRSSEERMVKKCTQEETRAIAVVVK